MRKFSIFLASILALLIGQPLFAQKLTLQAPSQAEVGQRIRVSYTLNNNDFDRIQIDGEFNGFNVLFGPSISTSSSISIINGKTTQSSSTTFTYTITPTKAGTFTLPSASLNSGGQKIKSGTAKIEVLPASDNPSAQQQSSQGAYGQYGGQNVQASGRPGQNRMHTPTSDENIGSRDLYFAVTASKKHVFEQEAILLTYKLYSLVTVEQLAGEIPQLDGFHTQEIEQPQQRSFTMERVGNKNYGTVVWRQYVVFPQKSGKLTIPAVDYEADVVVQDRNVDPFDAFFGGGSMMQRVKKIVRAPAVEIQVDPLPAKPANFSGAVGKGFSISGKLTPEQVDANDATTLTLTVNGTGNIKLISCPTIEWPKDFEQYDPKTNVSTKLTTSGTSGKVTYECVAVPHHGGKYTIPPVEFCYFDTDSKSYKTVRTSEFNLAVAKGVETASSVVQQEELKELGNDIHYIKQGDAVLLQHGDSFFGSLTNWLMYLASLLVFGVVYAVLRRRESANADQNNVLRRKASKAAAKRLRTASKLLRAGKEEPFYDEVMRAMWGYVAGKLSLPVTDLNKDNVSEKLLSRGVDEESTQKFLSVLSECEFARFAPGDSATNMDHLFNNATDVIDDLETKIQKA